MMKKRLAFDPLLLRIASASGLPLHEEPTCRWCGNATAADSCLRVDRAAASIGVSRRTFQQWRRRGSVPFDAADRVAIRLGWHPSFVWGRDWDDDTGGCDD